MKYNIEEILKKAYAKVDEEASISELNQEVMRRLGLRKKGGFNMRRISRFTRYAVVIIGLCFIATVTVSAYFIVKPYVDKQNAKEKEDTSAPITRWKIEGDTLIISGYGTMNATNRNPMDEWLSSHDIIKKVIIEEGITDIDGGAFKDFTVLESVEIADSVTAIGGGAFENCVALESITIPDSVTKIGKEAFKGCNNLENITMTGNLKTLGKNAFNDTKWFAGHQNDGNDGMVVKDGVVYYAADAVGDIKLGEDITAIADAAFCGSDIRSVEINADIDIIGYRMFMDCKNLREVRVLSEVTEIVEEAFSGCVNLENIELADSIIRIGRCAFANCASLEKLQLPAKVEVLMDEVFEGCSRLEIIDLPESLTDIGNGIFIGCDSLTTIYGVGGSLAENLALNGDYEFIKIAEGESVDKIFEYTGYDYISPLYYNQTWKYDSEKIGCEVYQWSEEVAIPVPMPEGGNGVQIVQGDYYLVGIDMDEWKAYVDMMSKEYDIGVSEAQDGSSGSIGYVDYEHNYTVSVTWSDYNEITNMRNYCSASVFVGTDYKNTQLSNFEVANMIMERLGHSNGSGFSVVRVTSEGNYNDGFDVYMAGSYICVIRDDEIVLLDSPEVFLGIPASVEFLEADGSWKAYITEYNGKSGAVGHNLTSYNLVDGVFVKGESVEVDSMRNGRSTPWVVLRKNSGIIEIYALENNDSLENVPYYGRYKVGDKVIIIDGEGVKVTD